MSLLSVSDYEKAAACVLDKNARDYYNGGAEEEFTLHRNIDAFRDYIIRPRCLRDSSKFTLSASFLDCCLPSPIAVAPTAFHRMAHADGELATVRGARRAGALMVCSSWATTPLEEIAREADGHPLWFQLYVYRERSLSNSLVRRAEASGYKALVLTVDTPILGRRLADTRNRFLLPKPFTFVSKFRLTWGDVLDFGDYSRLANFSTGESSSMPNADGEASGFMYYVGTQIDPSLTWKDVRELASSTFLPLIVKGILRGDDALQAVYSGAKVTDGTAETLTVDVPTEQGTIRILNISIPLRSSCPNTYAPRFNRLLTQKKPFIVGGNFNKHNEVWNEGTEGSRGDRVCDFIDDSDLI